ncbi:helix-turn-helix domain-containing protein [Actinoplanes sp. Pm04-4]|uniref:Helix-turn-helix domain-containing protein n=1 Tax=Paractinoplanes pyxinae TaxID=2997416 RepID=A0ABT4B5U3_9ACTN|nr:helix-turn-helix domain-containing protein [Actinoplanes pyxinae]MCY1141402.1 helix-turn-helix domain-containing protein [Actinoplanes pyxinae]
MPHRSREELRQALADGEWLRVGELAVVLGVSPSTAHRLLGSGDIEWKYKVGGKQRTANPADVRRLLEQAEQTHRGEPPQA